MMWTNNICLCHMNFQQFYFFFFKFGNILKLIFRNAEKLMQLSQKTAGRERKQVQK